MKKQINIRNLVFALLGGLVLLFIVGPLAGLFLSTTPNTLFETLTDKEVYHSIWLTLFTAMAATLFFSIAAIPFAYLLARKNFPFKKIVLGIIDLPIVIPHTAAGIAILGVISRDSMLGRWAETVGISFIGNPLGIAIAMAFVSIPFLINSARDGFASVPERLEKAALNLGASPIQVFFTISLPLAWRNIISGMIMMFARGMSEFGAVVIVAYYPMITPVLIWERFGAYGIKYAQPVAILFIAVTLLVFIGLRLLSKEKQTDH
ncbi:MAG: ABC transporter permease [Bacteroidetes bacterium]|nr:ABC transporter permease [Bacteroidota bacterium]MBL6963562.1 ABC transporter permease [Bacteroidota bacterium]